MVFVFYGVDGFGVGAHWGCIADGLGCCWENGEGGGVMVKRGWGC